MARRDSERQQSMWVAGTKLSHGPRNVFYDQLNKALKEIGFDRLVEDLCAPFYEADGTRGRPSVPPGVYFRMLLVGYFEGIESERGIAWRCDDSRSLQRFLGYEPEQRTPNHSTLSRIRLRLDSEVYEKVFRIVLALVQREGLLRGKTLGVDGTTLRADASMKAIVRKETGEDYQEYLRGLAAEAGIEEPSGEDLQRMDRKRKGKKLSNEDWRSTTDRDARIGRMKDGRTRMIYKAENTVDLDTGAIAAAELFAGDTGDTISMQDSIDQALENIDEARQIADEAGDDLPKVRGDEATCAGSTDEDSDGDEDDEDSTTSESIDDVVRTEVVGDKGYHKRGLLRELHEAGFDTNFAEPKQRGTPRFNGPNGEADRAAVEKNRARVTSPEGKKIMKLRGERLERPFAHLCETGAQRRVRLRGHENVRKRYLIHAAAANLGLVMRTRFGVGTPRGFADLRRGVVRRLSVLRLALSMFLHAVERWPPITRSLSARWRGDPLLTPVPCSTTSMGWLIVRSR